MTEPTRRPNALQRWANGGVHPHDPDDLRLKKGVLTIVSTSIAMLAIFWGSLYVAAGYPLSGAIPLTYTVIVLLSTLHFFRHKRFELFRLSQQTLTLLLPFLLMWSLGGFANGSAVMFWAFFAPLAALFFCDLRSATRWFTAFSVLLVVSALMDSSFAQWARPMPATLNTVYFLMNLGLGFALVSLVLHFWVRDRERAYVELQAREREIQRLLMTDPLTQIPNRRALDARLNHEAARAQRYGTPLCVIMADIDHFKRVNDTLGHPVGDVVLQCFARTLGEALRDTDLVARSGGEEFLVILPQTDLDTARAIAERLRVSTERLRIPGVELHLTASFGVAALGAEESVAELLSRADEAMYRAKHAGRNRVEWSAPAPAPRQRQNGQI